MVTACRDGRDVDIDTVNAPVGIHVQLRNEAAPDQTDPDFRHCRCLRAAVAEDPIYSRSGRGTLTPLLAWMKYSRSDVTGELNSPVGIVSPAMEFCEERDNPIRGRTV
jgi:hypothetical protein